MEGLLDSLQSELADLKDRIWDQLEQIQDLQRDQRTLKERVTELEAVLMGLPGEKQCDCPGNCFCLRALGTPPLADRLTGIQRRTDELEKRLGVQLMGGELSIGPVAGHPGFDREELEARNQAIARRIASWQEIPEGIARLEVGE